MTGSSTSVIMIKVIQWYSEQNISEQSWYLRAHIIAARWCHFNIAVPVKTTWPWRTFNNFWKMAIKSPGRMWTRIEDIKIGIDSISGTVTEASSGYCRKKSLLLITGSVTSRNILKKILFRHEGCFCVNHIAFLTRPGILHSQNWRSTRSLGFYDRTENSCTESTSRGPIQSLRKVF